MEENGRQRRRREVPPRRVLRSSASRSTRRERRCEPENGYYFSLNPVGGLDVRLLASGISVDDVTETSGSGTDAAPNTIRAAVDGVRGVPRRRNATRPRYARGRVREADLRGRDHASGPTSASPSKPPGSRPIPTCKTCSLPIRSTTTTRQAGRPASTTVEPVSCAPRLNSRLRQASSSRTRWPFGRGGGASGSVVWDLEVAGHVVRLRFAGEGPCPAAHPGAGAPPIDQASEDPDFTVSLFDTESTGVRMVPAPWDATPTGQKGEIAGYNDERFRTVYEPGVDCSRSSTPIVLPPCSGRRPSVLFRGGNRASRCGSRFTGGRTPPRRSSPCTPELWARRWGSADRGPRGRRQVDDLARVPRWRHVLRG